MAAFGTVFSLCMINLALSVSKSSLKGNSSEVSDGEKVAGRVMLYVCMLNVYSLSITKNNGNMFNYTQSTRKIIVARGRVAGYLIICTGCQWP